MVSVRCNMRNIFDQYEQSENRLTHALISTLQQRSKVASAVSQVAENQLDSPGATDWQATASRRQHIGRRNRHKRTPGRILFDDEDSALFVQSKVQAPVSQETDFERHLRSAAHNGYENAHVVVIAVNRRLDGLPEQAKAVNGGNSTNGSAIRQRPQPGPIRSVGTWKSSSHGSLRRIVWNEEH